MVSDDVKSSLTQIAESVNEALVVDEEFTKTVLTGLSARGHVLIEDVPGTGKTLTARALAESTGLEFNRIQFTPDLLPSDITGSHIYNEEESKFEFNKGPIFSNVLIADEINRAPPKTQAALLEAMGENQVTVDNKTFQLPDPFFVVATQNPVEQEGTFPLPEAQKDRFMIKTSIGYPDREGERHILDARAERSSKMPKASQAADKEKIRGIQSSVENIEANEKIRDYIVDICRNTREDERVKVGISPRGIQRLFEASRARALIESRDFVVPQDVKMIAQDVLTHRIILTPDSQVNNVQETDVVSDILNKTEVPEV